MKPIIDFHHYRTDQKKCFDRVDFYERYVIDTLLQSEVKDDQRESSIAFELKHHHGTTQFARILARQRNLPIDVCTVGALLHDIYVIKHGKYKDHAHKGANLAFDIIDEIGNFSDEEKSQILSIVYHHSDKDIWSEDPFQEFAKDVDILDCFLYPSAFGYYLKHKKLSVFYNYILRAKKIWDELNIPILKDFSILDNYNDKWFDYKLEFSEEEAKLFLKLICYLSKNKNFLHIVPPTFLLESHDNITTIYINSDSYKTFQTATKYLKNTFINDDYEEVNFLIFKAKKLRVIVWAAINTYEVIENPTRLIELGLNI